MQLIKRGRHFFINGTHYLLLLLHNAYYVVKQTILRKEKKNDEKKIITQTFVYTEPYLAYNLRGNAPWNDLCVVLRDYHKR